MLSTQEFTQRTTHSATTSASRLKQAASAAASIQRSRATLTSSSSSASEEKDILRSATPSSYSMYSDDDPANVIPPSRIATLATDTTTTPDDDDDDDDDYGSRRIPSNNLNVSAMDLISALDISSASAAVSSANVAAVDDEDDVWGRSLPTKLAESTTGPSTLSKSSSLTSVLQSSPVPITRTNPDLHNLEAMFDAHLESVVGASLVRHSLPIEWLDKIVSLGKDAAAMVSPSVVSGDDLDVTAYVRQEYVPGGVFADSEIIQGTVCFKRVAHKKMATSIPAPRILLLDTSIEHDRPGVGASLAHFDTLLVQEEEFLRLQVAKIMDVAPQVVVVSGAVARLARDFLLDAGVTLVPSVGSDLCARLARLTSAVVLTSVDAIRGNSDILGTCSQFRAQSLATLGRRKLVLVFDGTPPSLGVTLLLRGTPPPGWIDEGAPSSFQDTLFQVVQLATFAAMHAALELALYIDEGVQFSPSFEAWIQDRRISGHHTPGSTRDLVNSARSALNFPLLGDSASPFAVSFARRQDLSLSPGIWIPPPFVEEHPDLSHIHIRMSRQSARSSAKTRDPPPLSSATHSSGVQQGTGSVLGISPGKAGGGVDGLDRTLSTHDLSSGLPKDRNGERTTEVLRLQSDLIPPGDPSPASRPNTSDELAQVLALTAAEGAAAAVSPFDFQSLCVLFSTASVHKPSPCCIPHAQLLEFYQDSDMTLGQYLEVCFDLTNTCRQVNCQRDMLSHVCTYAHHTSMVIVRVDRMPSPLPGGDENAILLWSCCKRCDAMSPVRPLSPTAWRLSFGKYLEASFYPPPLVLADSSCTHSVHLDHIRYFACGSLLLSFEHRPVTIFGLNPPAPQLEFTRQSIERVLNTERVALLSKIDIVFHSHPGLAGTSLHHLSQDMLVSLVQDSSSRWDLNRVFLHLLESSSAATSSPTSAAASATASGDTSGVGKGKDDVEYGDDVDKAEDGSSAGSVQVWDMEHMHGGGEMGQAREPYAPYLVIDNEPTSVIGFTLASQAYADNLGSLGYNVDVESETANVDVLLAARPDHMTHRFRSRGFEFETKVFYAPAFHAVRSKYCAGGEGEVLESLARCAGWAATGGKSDSEFLKTLDDRLILKEVQKVEMKSFLDFAPSYFEYMMRVLYDDVPSLLIKFLGLFRVKITCKASGVKYSKYVVLMENLFYGKHIDRVFDLKGSERSRYVKDQAPDQVLMDENFLEYIWQSPLYVREHSKLYLYSALYNDSLFLASLKVMDYSLLVGIDYESGDLTVGIIDYIRQYTWDKQLESWVKRSGVLGGGGKKPTVISPHDYKDRFRKAMNRYFVVVPDKHVHPPSDS